MLYHKKPQKLYGDYLLPLNQLKVAFPVAYNREIKKYANREDLLTKRIDPLNCLWNDVIHLSPISPRDIELALQESGVQVFIDSYAIDPFSIDAEKAIIYSNGVFSPYDPKDLQKHSLIPQKTKDYYRYQITHGRKPLLHYQLPHIFYKGSIDMTLHK